MNISAATAATAPEEKNQEAPYLIETSTRRSHARGKTVPSTPPPGSLPPPSDPRRSGSFQRNRRPGGYVPGEAARSPSHMIAEPAPGRATEAVDSLSIPDCAFVKRSDGSFLYARLAYWTARASEECMAFLLNDSGSTKLTRKSQWSEYVRLISEDVEQTKHSTSLNAARTSSVQQEETRYVNKSNDRNNNHRVKSDNKVGACPSSNLTQQNQEKLALLISAKIIFSAKLPGPPLT